MYYFYRYAPIVLFIVISALYTTAVYKLGEDSGQEKTMHKYLQLNRKCLASPTLGVVDFRNKVPGSCGKSYTMFSYYFDATVANCVYEEFTK